MYALTTAPNKHGFVTAIGISSTAKGASHNAMNQISIGHESDEGVMKFAAGYTIKFSEELEAFWKSRKMLENHDVASEVMSTLYILDCRLYSEYVTPRE